MSDERGKELCAKTILAIAYLMGVNFSPYYKIFMYHNEFRLSLVIVKFDSKLNLVKVS